MERALQKEVVKQPIGRTKKQIDVVLLILKVEPQEQASIKAKVRGSYTNCFLRSLWKPIFAIVTQYKHLSSALNYLCTKYKLPREIYSIYDKISRSSLYGWFTNKGVLREECKQYITNKSSSFTGGTQHAHILSQFSKVEKELSPYLKAIAMQNNPCI